LGAGTGRLSIACAYFRPKSVISIDIDPIALQTLRKNLIKYKLNHIIFPLCTDIGSFEILNPESFMHSKITTIMNPPFGVQKSKADRQFLDAAFKFSNVIYSIHLTNKKVHKFILEYTSKFGWDVNYTLPFKMFLERSFYFHTQKMKEIEVTIYRLIKKKVK
jgi:putative methylase